MARTPAEDSSRLDYIRGELSRVDAAGEYPAKLQITSDAGSTKHLNITSEQFEAIRAILTGEQRGAES